MKMTPQEYYKKWAENCKIFENYLPIHSHEDMMRFALDYHNEQLRLLSVVKPLKENEEKPSGKNESDLGVISELLC